MQKFLFCQTDGFRIFVELEPETPKPMIHYPCETCKFRAQYDKRPESLPGRIWRWHINFCPGWKAYFTHQDEATKAALREKYKFTKYQ